MKTDLGGQYDIVVLILCNDLTRFYDGTIRLCAFKMLRYDARIFLRFVKIHATVEVAQLDLLCARRVGKSQTDKWRS